jgi:hypothetical protein
MEKRRRAALVFAGPVSRGSLTRLPGLSDQLEFIKSSSIPTASRAVNALRCGQAVRSYEELAGADLILLSAPDAVLPAIVSGLVSSKLDWRGRTVVLYDAERDSSDLEVFRRLGAVVATLNWCASPPRFLAEGDPEAIRRIRSLRPGKSLMVLRSKASYLQALRATTEDFYPLLAASVDLFRKAGMEKAAAEKTAASLFAESARTYLRAGKRLLQRPASKRPASFPAR